MGGATHPPLGVDAVSTRPTYGVWAAVGMTDSAKQLTVRGQPLIYGRLLGSARLVRSAA